MQYKLTYAVNITMYFEDKYAIKIQMDQICNKKNC